MDGYLDVLDAAVMALVVNGLKTIDEVYDIKKGDYDYDGEAYTESDLIAMYHVLSDIDSSAPTLSTSQKFASDLNYNGKVDEEDLNKPDSKEICYNDVSASDKLFTPNVINGDGVLPAECVKDEFVWLG